jgi:hypothetical protein
VTTKGMAVIGQNNSQREEYMDHILFPCIPQGGNIIMTVIPLQEYT